MAESKLTIEERHTGDVAVLVLTGQMLLDDGDLAFGKRISDLIDRGRLKTILDLGGLTYIDSSGVGELVSAFTSVRNQGGELKLLHLTKKVHDLLQITKLYTVFDVKDDETSAISSFAK